MTRGNSQCKTGRPAAGRALALIEEESSRALSIDDLANAAGLARRTLQRRFRATVGKPPIRTLRDLRFKTARRELLRAPIGLNVSDIASGCGFTHLARFAAEYRKRYGETPSATLRRSRESRTLPALPVPGGFFCQADLPTVALLPIESPPGDPCLARALVEELRVTFMRSHRARIVDLGRARYRLAGALSLVGFGVQLKLRLIEGSTGRLLWAATHNCLRGESDAFAQRVAAAAAAAIGPYLHAAEVRRVRQNVTGDLSSYELALRALPDVVALSKDSDAHAVELLERAIARDPSQPLALALAAWCHAQRVIYQFTDTPAQEREKALHLAARAAALAGTDAAVLTILGNAYNAVHDLQTARTVVSQALAFDGGNAWAWGRSAWIESYQGQPQAAVERFAIAIELSPHDPLVPSLHVGLGMSHFLAGRNREAVHWLERAVAKLPQPGWAYRMLCPAYAHLGLKDAAQRSRGILELEYPGVGATQMLAALPLTDADRQRAAEGLESAGLRP